MMRTETAERGGSSRGIFRDLDGIAPAESLFRQEEPAAGGTERYHVSAADDPEEIRAERTADQVTGGGSIFREADGPGAGGGEVDLPSADLVGPGSALPAGIQQSMGASMGADFSGVRVHTGAGADRASRDLSARAFARGQDLYFRSGEYNPGSQEGQHLIAHELAHVADGAEGLHRAPSGNQPAGGGNQSAAGNKPAISAPLVEDTANHPGEVDAEKVSQAVNGFVTAANDADILADGIQHLALDQIGTKKQDLETAKGNLDAAKQYYTALKIYLDDSNIGNIDSTIQASLESDKGTLEGLEIENIEKKVDDLLLVINSEQAAGQNVPLPEAVKDMLTSPYFNQFLKAVNQLRGAGGFADAEEEAAKDAKAQGSEMSAEDKRNYIQHRNEVRGDTDTGITKAEDSSTWMGKAGAAMSAVGGAAGEVSESAGALTSEAAKQKGYQEKGIPDGDLSEEQETAKSEVDEEASEKGETVAGAMAASAEGLGAIGAGLSMAQNSKDAEAQRKQDARAKQTMKGIAKQLRRTLPLQSGTPSVAAAPAAGGAAQNNQARIGRIQAVCNRIEQSKFSDEKVSLEMLIEDAMDENPDVKPELQERQKGMLSTILALETSRASSKEKASELRQGAVFDAMDMVGAALRSAGGFISSLGGSGIAGAVLSMIGSIFGQIRGVRDAIAGEEADGGDENEKKLAASRSAIQQMAALPELAEETQLRKKASGEEQQVSGGAVAVAEQYAAAFFTIESANVNMSDILFAIEKGEFGKKTGPGANDKKSTADSLKDLYDNLSFS